MAKRVAVTSTVESSVHALIRAARSPRASRRALPEFMIIGAQKGGTTSLFHYLTACPDVLGPLKKELHYYDHNFERGERWYRSNFPVRPDEDGWAVGESSPYYLLHPTVPSRVAGHLPATRLIVLLRNPVSRAYSHYHHTREFGREPLDTFEAAIAAESQRTDAAWDRLVATGVREPAVEWYSYKRRGVYAPQLRRWFDYFPRESMLIMTAEELYKDPRGGLNRARKHIGLDEIDIDGSNFEPRNVRKYPPMLASTKAELGQTYLDDMLEVEEIIGRPTGWTL